MLGYIEIVLLYLKKNLYQSKERPAMKKLSRQNSPQCWPTLDFRKFRKNQHLIYRYSFF